MKKAALSVLVLILFFIGAGVVYTFFSGQQEPKASKPAKKVSQEDYKPIKPKAVDPKGPVGIAQESITSPVAPGANAAVTIKTKPNALCHIAVTYNNVPSTDSGLSPKKADAFGSVTWTWTVGPNTPVGAWPVSLTCAENGKSAAFQTYLQVQKANP